MYNCGQKEGRPIKGGEEGIVQKFKLWVGPGVIFLEKKLIDFFVTEYKEQLLKMYIIQLIGVCLFYQKSKLENIIFFTNKKK